MKKPKKWTQVYPQGTKAGDEEQKFFIGKNRQSGLARHPQYKWRSTESIVLESGLPVQTVEAIINKYVKMGLIVSSPTRPDHWGYWERVPEVLENKNDKSISDLDKNDRIKNHMEEN